ncbi:MAG: hypothetical protein WBM34_17005, partial [Woeseiaceae bacterium]
MLNQATHLSLIPSLLPGVKAANTETTEFDREFRQFYVDRMLPVTRAALGLWLALIVVVSILDRFLMPSTFAEQVLSFRVLAMMAPLSAALAASFIL